MLDANADGKVDANEMPPGVYRTVDGMFDYTPEAKAEIDHWQAELDILEHRINDAEAILREAQAESRDNAPVQDYLLTVGKIKEALGSPDAITKTGADRQLWSYNFGDGAVQISVTLYSSPDPQSLDDDQAPAMLNPDEVEMY